MTDDSTILQAQQQMQKAALALAQMSDDLADAKQIKEFNHDRHKRALSMVVTEFLSLGESAAAAEHHARASTSYGTQLHDLGEQYRSAMRVIEKADALRVIFESSRSLLSVERAKLGLL